ncbi:Mitochondrial adenine nucleotide transporter ADNT1 [Camellia lanceoleosa]|uniref:Mitochondrial adenine nucleotide transporter ADNT1 n=1 Tax=Camellia lanceoleosa TaxID=1840588 RepID=A0ACC0IIJ4_9ERIC|nr:Mitochondrial adenine nucleotide transporter ADNT1 [Camellia lanceoleosa]
MAFEDVVLKMSETMVLTIFYLAEEVKIARERVKALSHALLSICKSFVAGGVAGGVSPQCSQTCISISVFIPSLSLFFLFIILILLFIATNLSPFSLFLSSFFLLTLSQTPAKSTKNL